MILDGCPHVIVVEPVTQPNPRMTAQQGILLSNRSNRLTFSDCLLGMQWKSPVAAERQVVSKVIVRRDQRTELLKRLELMGIDSTSMLRPDATLAESAEGVVKRLREQTEEAWNQHRRTVRLRMESRNPRE